MFPPKFLVILKSILQAHVTGWWLYYLLESLGVKNISSILCLAGIYGHVKKEIFTEKHSYKNVGQYQPFGANQTHLTNWSFTTSKK